VIGEVSPRRMPAGRRILRAGRTLRAVLLALTIAAALCCWALASPALPGGAYARFSGYAYDSYCNQTLTYTVEINTSTTAPQQVERDPRCGYALGLSLGRCVYLRQNGDYRNSGTEVDFYWCYSSSDCDYSNARTWTQYRHADQVEIGAEVVHS
jgi:hypothetical protein